jgi:hypothetical protein
VNTVWTGLLALVAMVGGVVSSAIVGKPLLEIEAGRSTLLLTEGACVVADTTLPFPGAYIHPDSVKAPCGVLLFNPKWFESEGYSPQQNIFVLLHEYGHMTLQHEHWRTVGPEKSRLQEREADCYAARVVAKKWPEIIPLVVDFWKSVKDVGNDPYHEPNAERAQSIAECAANSLR